MALVRAGAVPLLVGVLAGAPGVLGVSGKTAAVPGPAPTVSISLSGFSAGDMLQGYGMGNGVGVDAGAGMSVGGGGSMDIDEYTQRQALRACALASQYETRDGDGDIFGEDPLGTSSSSSGAPSSKSSFETTSKNKDKDKDKTQETVWRCMKRVQGGAAITTVKRLMSSGDEVERGDANNAVAMLARSIEDMDEAMELLSTADDIDPNENTATGSLSQSASQSQYDPSGGLLGTFSYPAILRKQDSYLAKSVVGRNVGKSVVW